MSILGLFKTNIKFGWVPKLHVGMAYNTQMNLG